ncbi:MAG: hypothetical protein ABIN61_09200 [candidate division WOR-3 bacterium]
MKNLRFKTYNLLLQIFSRKIGVGISLVIIGLIFNGCSHWEEEEFFYHSPNWTSDGRVVFVKEIRVWKWERSIFGESAHIKSERTWLCEVNADGSGMEEKGFLFDDPAQGINSTSSAGDWVVLGDVHYNSIWVIRRDGTGLQKVGEGQNPDFSPDASKIVYEKPGEGIWIMDRDGGNDHQIIADPDAKYPAWSPDDTLIAYGYGSVHIYNLIASQQVREFNYLYFPDWYSNGKFVSICASPEYDGGIDIDIYNDQIDTLRQISSGYYLKVSSDGNKFVAYDGSWFVINRDGTGKWYLRP